MIIVHFANFLSYTLFYLFVSRQFQLTVARRMLLNGGELPQPPPEETERLVLGKLKKDVGSVRQARGAAGVLATRKNNRTSKQVTIFQVRATYIFVFAYVSFAS